MKFAIQAIVSLVLCGSACTDFKGDPPPDGEVRYPVGIAVHPSGNYVYVLNANFDAKYREETGGSVVTLDASTLASVGNTVRTGSFGSDLVLGPGIDGVSAARLYATVRGDDSIVVLEVSPDGSTITCPLGSSGLDCRIQNISNDPFAVVALPRAPQEAARFAVTSLNGDLSLVTLPENAGGFDISNVEVFARGVAAGASALTYFPPTDDVLVGGRSTVRVRGISWILVDGVAAALGITSIGDVFSSGTRAEMRALALAPDMTKAYLTTNSPDAIVEIDTTVTDDGSPATDIVRQFPVQGGPADLIVVREGEADVIYTALVDDDALGVVDAASGLILDSILLGETPYSMAFHAPTQSLYVVLFEGHDIVRVDLNPESETFREVISRTP